MFLGTMLIVGYLLCYVAGGTELHKRTVLKMFTVVVDDLLKTVGEMHH
jgi:hypothetical protein